MFACFFRLLSLLFPSLEWTIPTKGKIIYLTFDDGPIPIVTDFVLDQLKKYNANATFFCVGDNVGKHPNVFRRIIDEGHGIGNHTFNHLNGWKTRNEEYYKNIETSDRIMKDEGFSIMNKMLFRPPYGKITPSQVSHLKPMYRIIMWDILTGDYDHTLAKEKCLERALAAKSGSIVIFHDSYKAEQNMRFALPKFLEYYTQRGFVFKSL